MNEKTVDNLHFGASILVIIAVGCLIALGTCGCAGTKMANSANSYELTQQGKALDKLGQYVDKTNPDIVSWFNAAWFRLERMRRLQTARNENEGMANVPPSDDLLPVAIMKLKQQGATLGTILGLTNAVGGTVFGSYWKEILGALALAGIGAWKGYQANKNKKLAVANTKAIEAYGVEHPEASKDLKDLQRRYLAKTSGHDRLIQKAAAAARGDYSFATPSDVTSG